MNIIKSFRYFGGISNAFSKVLQSVQCSHTINNSLHEKLVQPRSFSSLANFSNSFKLNRLFLTPTNLSVVPSCGIKVRGKLQLRCKDCYLARVNGRMMVLCNSYPRHKQMAMVKREKYTWIITSVSQTKKRPY